MTDELGSKEDYAHEFRETPFGRRIAKFDHNAAMTAFSAFINDQALNQNQIAFLHKIIQYIEQNGYMESFKDLQKQLFDKPISFIKLFDAKARTSIMEAINKVKDNALNVAIS